MSYREVTMLEIKEFLRLWCGGAARKLSGRQVKKILDGYRQGMNLVSVLRREVPPIAR